MFFYDRHGGHEIGVVFKASECFSSRPFKFDMTIPFKPVGFKESIGKKKPQALVQADVENMINAMCDIGGELIKDVTIHERLKKRLTSAK
jgi:hypothetical protein